MDAEFVSFAAVMIQSHLYLTTQAFVSNLSSRKDLFFLAVFFHRTFGMPSALLIKFISSDIESGLCFMSMFLYCHVQ